MSVFLPQTDTLQSHLHLPVHLPVTLDHFLLLLEGLPRFLDVTLHTYLTFNPHVQPIVGNLRQTQNREGFLWHKLWGYGRGSLSQTRRKCGQSLSMLPPCDSTLPLCATSTNKPYQMQLYWFLVPTVPSEVTGAERCEGEVHG